jgi:hypothetical protein
LRIWRFSQTPVEVFDLQDIQNKKSLVNNRILAEILSTSWHNSPPSLPFIEEQLTAINPLIQETGLGGFGWWRIGQSPLAGSEVGLELQQIFRLQALQAAKQELEIQQIFQYLRDAGVEPILIKGWAINRLYPAKGLRPCGDIDLFVRPQQYAKAKEVRFGSKAAKISIDIEHEELEKLDQQSIEDLFKHSQLVKLGEADIRLMSDEDHLRFLCIHLLRHGAWRPLWLCDIAVAVESRQENFDWQRCLGKDKNRADWVLCTIRLAHELLGANIADTPAANQKLPDWLLPTVFKQWRRPCSKDHAPPELIMTSLRHPTRIAKAIGDRWPDPISASIRMNAPCNDLPRLPFQMANYARSTVSFIARLAKLLVQSAEPKDDFRRLS